MIRSAILCACIGINALCFRVLDFEKKGEAVDPEREIHLLPRVDYLEIVDLGYRNVLSDIIWFNFISYFGYHYARDREYRWLDNYCDSVIRLDPFHEIFYRICSSFLLWDTKDVDNALLVLEEWEKRFPDNWEAAFQHSFARYFFRQEYQHAAEILARVLQFEGVPPIMANIEAKFRGMAQGTLDDLLFKKKLEKLAKEDRERRLKQFEKDHQK